MAKVVRLVISCDLCGEAQEADFSLVLADNRPLDLCAAHFAGLGEIDHLRVLALSGSSSGWAQRSALATG